MGSSIIFQGAIVIILLLISYIDIKTRELPNSLTLLLILLGVGYNLFFDNRIVESVIGMGTYSLPFSLIYGYISDIYGKDVLGFGDIKLAMGVGAVLTFSNFYNLYLFFLGSFVTASIYCIYLLIKIKKNPREVEIPFAPFISISGCIMIILGGVV